MWQPLEVFGAFSPVALDTEYKPGIDAVVLDWNPSELSSMTAAYVFSPDNHDTISDAKNSAVVRYSRLLGKLAELSLIAGQVNNNQVLGASLEGGFRGAGLRFETSYYNLNDGGTGAFSVVGADYKFQNSTVIAVELYNNTFGAATEHDMATQQNSLLTQGIQPHLSRNVLGLTAQRDISPLLNAGYTLLAGQLDDAKGGSHYSFLHQVNLKYSLGSQSDVLFSLLHGTGKGIDDQGKVRSEFGQIPTSINARWSYYF